MPKVSIDQGIKQTLFERKNEIKNKNILVTGGTGMIGQELVQQLISEKANITVVSLDKINLPKGVKFLRLDLREFSNCLKCLK